MIFIVGPTCSGKTTVAIELAKSINGEIISADSRQIYKYLSVGTAKPAGSWELEAESRNQKVNNQKFYVDGIPYYLVDFLDPSQYFSAGEFVRATDNIIEQIKLNKKTAIIAGGTGLYISSYLYGLTNLPERNENLRTQLIKLEKQQGKGYLYKELSKIDPKAARKIHPNNLHRIIRALEVYYLTGKPISQLWNKKVNSVLNTEVKLKVKNYLLVGLYLPREILYKRINSRVEYMLQSGMIEETQRLLKEGYTECCPAFQSIGYKHVISFLKKEISYNHMKESIKKDTRNYAKRQMTWFKRDKEITWIDINTTGLTKTVKLIKDLWKKSLL